MLESRWQKMRAGTKIVSGLIEKGSSALGRWLDHASRQGEKDEVNRSEGFLGQLGGLIFFAAILKNIINWLLYSA